ncbi:MAG TPA: Amuc_1100 family pilus-like protein [Verrucomicrobiae bacterium]|nr:Amuc_1100 family pilus-like protein [Verrucomicrobiae bacterium]
MSWIKRHLFSLIGGVVALVLMVCAGLYLGANWKRNSENLKKLDDAYNQLDQLSKENPQPGNNKVNNIQAAKDQQQELRSFIGGMQKWFTPVPPIPASTNVTGEQFAAALRRTIDQLQHDASEASVILPPKFDFSFEAQRSLVQFQGNLNLLASQLGDIKVICDVLNNAKVNSVDNIRRERVSSDDLAGLQSSYLSVQAVTNDLAVLTPYEITFRGFSAELASVLQGFAHSPYCIIVKSINVEPAAGASGTPGETPEGFGRMPGGPYRGPYEGPYGEPRAMPTQQRPTITAVGASGLPIILDEKQLRITMMLEVVKMLPQK